MVAFVEPPAFGDCFIGDFVDPLVDVRDIVDVRLALLGDLGCVAVVLGVVVVGDFLVITGFSRIPFVELGVVFLLIVIVVSMISLRIPLELRVLLLPSLTRGPITRVLSKLNDENSLGNVSLSKLSISSNSSPNRLPLEENVFGLEWELRMFEEVLCLVVITVRRVVVTGFAPPAKRLIVVGVCCVFVIVVVLLVAVLIGFNG